MSATYACDYCDESHLTESDCWLRVLMAKLGGSGEFLDPKRVRDLWLDYSADLSAMRLYVDDVGDFCGWLISRRVA